MERRLSKTRIFSLCLCAQLVLSVSCLSARPKRNKRPAVEPAPVASPSQNPDSEDLRNQSEPESKTFSETEKNETLQISLPAAENSSSDEISVAADSAEKGSSVNTNQEDSTKVKISIPSAKRTYFSKIPHEIMEGIEQGSPASIRQALSSVRKSESEYSETERVLVNVANSIFQFAWPSQKISFEVPSYSEQNPYMGALNLAKEGFFDSSTGNTDFLSTLLPAMVLLYKGDLSESVIDQCEKAVNDAFSFRETSVLGLYLKARLLERKGEYEPEEEILSLLYQNNSNIFELAVSYAAVLLKNGKNTDAFSLASRLREKYPMDVQVLDLNAKAAFALEKYDEAEEYVAYILQQNPNNLEFVLFRARILAEKKDYIHAVSLLDMYAKQNDSNVDYLLLRAKVQIEWTKSYTQAAEVVEKALSLYPSNQDAMLLAARIASVTDSPVAGKYADELVEKILEKKPDNEEALIYALNGLARREAWWNAYEISSQLMASGKYRPEVVEKHVEICLKLGKTAEALSSSDKAYKENPSDETILQAYILAQVSSGNRNQSMNLINSLLETSSSKVKSYLYYRRSFLQVNEAQVLADLRSSMIANPRNSDALFRLYEIYFEKEDYKKAQYYLKQVVALNPNDSSIKKLNESLTKLLQ